MKTILVTGAAGFIGSNFVDWLQTRRPEYRILVVDALTYAGSRNNLVEATSGTQKCQFWHGDVRDAELVERLVAQSDIVIHMAAESHVTRSLSDDRVFFETDVLGTLTVATAVARNPGKVERFIHISSSEVYGTALAEMMDEEHPLNPMNPYAAAKCGADRLVYAYWASYGIPAVIVRPFNAFGPRQHLEKVIPRFITGCLLGEPLVVHGDGAAARDFTFVEDLCAGLERLLDIERDLVVGETINLGSGRHRTVLEIASAVRDRMRPKSPITFVGDRPGQIVRHTCDAAKAERLLGWTPKITFEDGLQRTIDWYRRHEPSWRPQLWARHIPIITAAGTREMH